MTERQQQEFDRLIAENEEFRTAIRIVAKTVNNAKNVLGIDILSIRSLEDVIPMVSTVMMNFQMGELSLDELLPNKEELNSLLPTIEKYRHLVDPTTPKQFA